MIDAERIYESLKERLTGTLKSALTVKGPADLQVNRIWTEDKLEFNDLDSQLQAKLAGRSWAIPVYADVTLVDRETGKKISRSEKMRVMEIPKLTPRYSFIVDGEEFQVANQLRLKPGVYVRNKKTRTSTSFKFPIGHSSSNFSIDYEPAEKRWTTVIDGKTVPLYSYLYSMGITDDQIVDALGLDALDNMKKASNLKRDVAKLRVLVTGDDAQPQNLGENSEAIREKMFALPVDPAVLKTKFGKTYEHFEPDLIVKALKNMKSVLDGDEPGDIDSSRFKEFRTFDDILVERVEKSIPAIHRRIQTRMREKKGVREIIQPEKISGIVTSFFNRSQLSTYPSQNNPVNLLAGVTRTTVFGEGSIGNKRAISKEERDVDPSMFAALDPIHTPESGDVGAVTHITAAAKKGDGVLLVNFYNPKTKKYQDVAHPDIYDKKIAFSDQYEKGFKPKERRVKAIYRGRVVDIKPDEVDLISPQTTDLFDFSSNLIPFLNAIEGGRALMASKMYDQAVSLSDPDKPLVQSRADNENTFDDLVGKVTSTIAPVAGTITRVGDRSIHIKDSKGETHKVQIYKDFPLNGRSYITSKPLVKAGDKVKADEVIADSNFTKDGVLAIGKNLRVAWLPARGWNFEDGIVISESAASKLTSSHMYKMEHTPKPGGLAGKEKFSAYFPAKYTKVQLDKLDADGIVKVGQRVSTGDPVSLYLSEKAVNPEDVILGRISRKLVRPYSDQSQAWDEPFEGEVTHVEKFPNGTAKVFIKTIEPMQVGDKMVSRYAAKGLVTKIVPDGEMPHTPDGKHVEVLLNPIGLPTRMNPSQIYDALAGKIAEKTGKPYVVQNFSGEDFQEQINRELKRNDVEGDEQLIDPTTGKSLGKVAVGTQHFLKLEHVSKEKFAARDPNNSYTADLRPAKAGEGAQTIGHMELGALLSHGAMHNIRDMATYKATRNDEFWRAVHMKEPLPPAEPTFAFNKFVNLLKGAGINVERRGTKYQLKPLTDTETLAMSAGPVDNSRMLLGKNLEPEKGGLFDERLTGGLSGKRWAHVELPYEIPNPVFENAIRGVLGLTQKRFNGIISEDVHVDRFGKIQAPEKGGRTGPEAIKVMLSAISIPQALRELKRQARVAEGSDLNSINRAIRFLSNLRENRISIQDLFITKVPVLPPVFRPVYPLPDGTLNVSDVNYLYRDLVAIRNQVRDLKGQLPDGELKHQRSDLYQAVKAVAGLGDPISSKHYRGIIDVVTGEHPKASYFQSRVLKKRQEISGRAAIVGNPTLGMDEVGIPEEMAWKIFHPFVVQKLVEQGRPPLEADRMITDRDPMAREALSRALTERPVILNRAPTLHKHGIMAMKARTVPGKSIELNEMVTAGFGADYDGDTMAVHIPVTPQAVDEAWDMLPSANPFNVSEKILTIPQHEAQVGLYRLTQPGKKTSKSYPNEVEAVLDFHEGNINETDLVRVGGVDTTVGRVLVNRVLPENLREPDLVLDKKKTMKILESVVRENPREIAPVADTLRDIGNEYAYLSGLSVGMKDLHVPRKELNQIFDRYDRMAAEAMRSIKDTKKLDKKILEIYSKADSEIQDLTKKAIQGTSLGEMVASGGRGNLSQVKQVIATPGLITDIKGRTHPHLITTNYAIGMSSPDYWTALYGARKGRVEQLLQTAEPGAMTKSLVATSIENRLVPGEAPDYERGIEFDVDDREALGRFITKDVEGVAARGELFNERMREKMRKARVKQIELGSPLTTTHPHGTYALSYGVDERGVRPKPGAFIGVTASQAIGEPMTQLTLSMKHHGGVASPQAQAVSNFDRLKLLLRMPAEVKEKALIAKEPGTVDRITKVPGGHEVSINKQVHFTPFLPTVKSGQKIKLGDRLSEGVIDPRDVLETKGLDATRRHITDEVYSIFDGKVRKKHIETVVRSATDTALVTNTGDRTDYVEGDIVPINVAREENRKAATNMPIRLARNMMLMEDIKELGGVEKILTEEDLNKLQRMGKSQVRVTPNPLQYKPILKGVDLVPLQRKDWMAALSFRRLGDTVRKGVAEGWKTDVKGWNPIPGIAYGASIAETPSMVPMGRG